MLSNMAAFMSPSLPMASLDCPQEVYSGNTQEPLEEGSHSFRLGMQFLELPQLLVVCGKFSLVVKESM